MANCSGCDHFDYTVPTCTKLGGTSFSANCPHYTPINYSASIGCMGWLLENVWKIVLLCLGSCFLHAIILSKIKSIFSVDFSSGIVLTISIYGGIIFGLSLFFMVFMKNKSTSTWVLAISLIIFYVIFMVSLVIPHSDETAETASTISAVVNIAKLFM